MQVFRVRVRVRVIVRVRVRVRGLQEFGFIFWKGRHMVHATQVVESRDVPRGRERYALSQEVLVLILSLRQMHESLVRQMGFLE